jgi:hypothetical protein
VKKDEQNKLLKSLVQELNRSIVDFIHEFHQNVSNFQNQILTFFQILLKQLKQFKKVFRSTIQPNQNDKL